MTRGRVTGVGGVFLRSADPAATMRWYRDVLGIVLEDWGGAMLHRDAPERPSPLVLNAMSITDAQMAPSTRDVMLNFAVDDLDAVLARVAAMGVAMMGRDDGDANGRFAWLLDPDGTKVELWEPTP